jgi:signal transduction histidine kinase
MFRSATFKLTLWYIAIVMAISITFSFVVFRLASSELAHGFNMQTQQWYNKFPAFDADPFFSQHSELNTSRHEIFLHLVNFNIIVLAGAGVASYLLARITLQPIEEAHARQKRFTSDVSHELRTPLTALRMESEVALMDGNASKQNLRDTLTSNIEESQKLETLINNLLKLSNLEAGQASKQFDVLKTKPLVDEAIAHVALAAKAKSIDIKSQVKDLPIYGDQGSLVQLLVILLDNAIKYSSENGKINIDSHKDGDYSVITVKDEGSGIDPESLKHVFERFYRADKARGNKSGPKGFGLGLSIAKNIADIHHANISLKSRIDKGTTATLELPSKRTGL